MYILDMLDHRTCTGRGSGTGKAIPLLVLLALLAGHPTPCRGDIYQYVDPEGIVHLTNIPIRHDVSYILVMKEKRVVFKLRGDVTRYDPWIVRASEKYRVDAALVKAIIRAESNFDPRAVSPVGAQGLMQLMPSTATALQVSDSFHPEDNIDGGVRYIRYLMNLFKGDLPLVLAAYNAGENAVLRYNCSIPPYPETRTYVRRVMDYLASYRDGPRDAAPGSRPSGGSAVP